jgi:hypothetical protein
MGFEYYNKAIIAFFTALGTWGATASLDGGIDSVEAWGLCGVIVTTLTVFQVKNKRRGNG